MSLSCPLCLLFLTEDILHPSFPERQQRFWSDNEMYRLTWTHYKVHFLTLLLVRFHPQRRQGFCLSVCVNSKGPHLSTQSLNWLEVAVHTQYIGRAMLRHVFWHRWTSKTQISLCISAVWSMTSLLVNRIIGYYRMYKWWTKAQMILSHARWSESAQFAHVQRHIFAWCGPWNILRYLESWQRTCLPKT